jgi:hypothetical protein
MRNGSVTSRGTFGRQALLLSLMVGLVLIAMPSAAPLPAGNVGIASRYPLDSGIASDAAVIFADDFESYGSAANLTSKWSQAYHAANLRIATESANVFAGGKSVELTVPRTSSEVSNTLLKSISPERDALFLRYYAKFDAGFNVVGSSHNGSTIQAHYCCPGVRADGFNKFLVSYEAWRDSAATANPGRLNAYIYHPDQRDIWGDHFFPTGIVLPFSSVPFNYGPEFVSRPDVTPVLGRWYSYELMVKANTPGMRDGRVAFWLDGELIADFPNLRLRETTTLKIDRFTIDLHVYNNNVALARKWYDNVVTATSYIGPMVTRTPPRSPTGFRIVQ